ncbi:MAG: site-2 protease family protein [Eubacteriales bacterium]|nr:site-2 protease family protein [Eubacteriales bacterium]
MTILYILLAIVLLGVLIMVHEYGHFIAARLTGIAVKEYSVGMGPKLWQRKSKKHETLFTLRAIPMGGYCMFYGDETDQQNADDPRAFDKAKVWKRMLTVFSGPLMNFVLAFVLAVGLMAGYGYTLAQPSVTDVEASMPAAAAGLQPGDTLTAINGQTIAVGDASALTTAINALGQGESFTLTVQRGEEALTIPLTPVWDEAEQRNRIGIGIRAYAPLAFGQIVPAAWDSCVYASTAILDSLGKLVTTGEGVEDTAGPIGVVQLVAQETQNGGFEIFLNLAVIISINLGLINLLPIPGLDGSRLVFMLVEVVRRKPISRKIEATVHLVGYALLLGLMVFFTFRDVSRIITG